MTIPIRLEPVDSVSVTTLVDNFIDVFLPDEGPASRAAFSRAGRSVAAPLLEPGIARDVLTAEHGFSALVTVA